MEMTPTPPRSKFRNFIRWLSLIIGAFAVFVAGFGLAESRPLKSPQSLAGTFFYVLVHVFVVACILTLLVWLFRWGLRRLKWFGRLGAVLFTWRNARRLLAGLVILATLIAVFYAEENGRGKRAWEKCKRELEAKGEMLDWSAYIPAPIPDDLNIFKAPKMTEWFVRPNWTIPQTNELSPKMVPNALLKSAADDTKSPILIARLVVIATNSLSTNSGDVVIELDALDASERLGRIVEDAVGKSMSGPQSFTFVEHSTSQIKPRRVLLQTGRRLSAADLSAILPTDLVPSNVGKLRVEDDIQTDSFRLVLLSNPVIGAAEYLAWGDPLTPEFDLIREALKRPHIRMDGDFQRSSEMPIVNFVFVRDLAQTAASRAQCCLLLGRSEQAFHELSLVYELRRLLAAKPTMLVSAMIEVAIMGLYESTIADGLRLQAWCEPELAALQKQIREINLPPTVAGSFRCERASLCETLRVIPPGKIAETFSLTDPRRSWWDRVTDRAFPTYLLLKFAPRGWIYQNLVTITAGGQGYITIFNPETRVIQPSKAADVSRELERLRRHWNPFTIAANFALPNYSKAMQTAARNQTLANQALIVCGLERYRRAQGEYPETLDALVPQFVEKLPHDIIGGQPLHYRRTADGKFVLYSVGWNETDDGGEPGLTGSRVPDYLKGDWVWETSAK